MRIGEWILDVDHNELRRGGEAQRLEPKAIELLTHLARHAGHVVGREELLAAVWPGVVVGDDALTQVVIKLRKALGDEAHHPRYIETISKRGYRLIAPVDDGAVAESPRKRRIARSLGIVAAGAVIAFAAAAWLWKPPALPWPLGPEVRGVAGGSLPVLAVLPLANLSGDPRRDYFVDGISEDIIDALGHFSGLRVMSRNAVRVYKGKSPAPQEVREALGARYIVQGSVREADGKVRVAVELTSAEEGRQLWSERHDAEGARMLEVQDRIARNIAGALAVKLTAIEKQRALSGPIEDLEAHDLVMRARALMERLDRAANREARTLLARAERGRPDDPEVLTARCGAEFQRAMYGWIEDPSQGAARAETLCKRALASPDTRAHSRAHAQLASIYSNQGRFDECLYHAGRALELNPSDSTALYRRGSSLLYVGRVGESIESMTAARRFDPYAYDGVNLAIAYYVADRYADSLAQADALLPHYPKDWGLHAVRAAALAQLGRKAEARRAADEVLRHSPTFELRHYGTRFADYALQEKMREGLRKAGL